MLIIIIITIIYGNGSGIIIITCQIELLSHGQRLLKPYHMP